MDENLRLLEEAKNIMQHIDREILTDANKIKYDSITLMLTEIRVSVQCEIMVETGTVSNEFKQKTNKGNERKIREPINFRLSDLSPKEFSPSGLIEVKLLPRNIPRIND